MLHPTSCCLKGVHVVETEIAPGVRKCIWCGKPRLVPKPEATENERTQRK